MSPRDEMLLHLQLERCVHPANKPFICFHAFGVGPVVRPISGEGTYIVHYFDKYRAPSVRFINALGDL